MAEFLTAIALFAAAHAIPPIPSVRKRAIYWLGKRTYIAAYSALSVLLLVWIIAAARRAPYWPLWNPEPWQALVPVLTMPFAAWLLTAGLLEPNPLSVAFRETHGHWQPGPAASVTRHPIVWAFLLWSGSHMVANGDVVSLILFGGMALLSVAGMAALGRRARRRLGGQRWNEYAGPTSVVPFVAILAGRARVRLSRRLVSSIALAVVMYVWFLLQGHRFLIGVDPLAWFAG